MNKKRLVINSIISIILVSLLFIGNTYSIFTTGDTEEDINVYTTGNLDITYTLSSETISLNSKAPINEKNSYFIEPYRITIQNNGTVPYQFNLILNDTTASDVINYNYVMTKVGKLESLRLSNARDNIIKEGVIVLAGESVDIDVRVWLSDDVINSEIGKSFYAKLSVDGIAIYNDNGGYDNSNLIYPISSKILSTYLKNLYDNKNQEEVSLDEESQIKINLDNKSNIMLDNNNIYRYYGDNPNNYISFNNELWRIVSISNVYYDDKDLTEISRVKIVRNKSIGNYKLNNELISKLDDLYFNSIKGSIDDTEVDFTNNGINKESRNMIDTTLYYNGNIQNDEIYEIYTEEKNSSITSKVGLISLSDYVYANNYLIEDNKINNWLYKNNGIATISQKDNIMISINSEGKYVNTNDNIDIYPCLYLKPDIILKNGTGTETDPYIITYSQES